MTISLDIPQAIGGIVDAVDPGTLNMEYPAALGGILNQHGWNLLWFGVATLVGGVYIWRGSVTAIFVTAIVGGLADLGYFLFLDLGGFVNFVPGTIMTLICAAAILTSLGAYYKFRKN
jgi:CHASE2 domain-containing sensor protein